MKIDNAHRNLEEIGHFLVGLALPDKIGDLNFTGSQPHVLGGELAGEGGGDFVEIDAYGLKENFLIFVFKGAFQLIDKRHDQFLDIGQHLAFQFFLGLGAFPQQNLEGGVDFLDFAGPPPQCFFHLFLIADVTDGLNRADKVIVRIEERRGKPREIGPLPPYAGATKASASRVCLSTILTS